MLHSFARLITSCGTASARAGPPILNEQCALIGSLSSSFMPGRASLTAAIAFSRFSRQRRDFSSGERVLTSLFSLSLMAAP